MTHSTRRDFLRAVAATAGASATLAMFPPAIRRALAIPAHRRTGTLQDVEHIVIFMQENRSFDHYFGTLPGVRGFGDRFPIPVADFAGLQGKNVWYQPNGVAGATPPAIAPFHLDTNTTFEYMRVEGTPHTWPNAAQAHRDGLLNEWPRYKDNHSLGYFTQADIPFQFALADAFTLCDAYHCSFHGGTNPNRLFLWTGTNDPQGRNNGPAITNEYDNLDFNPERGYTWQTYCERLEAAGVTWRVYQDMADNFTDNPLAGFRTFRASYFGEDGADTSLAERGLSTRALDGLREDVLGNRLPQVSFIVSTAEGSEHPGPSSPAQGAAYTAQLLDALTANPEVWSKTVLLLNFDENDGFFDHVPPPAAPSFVRWDADPSQAVIAGASTVDTTGEFHEILLPDDSPELIALQHKPYGLGPRVPLYVISPWSKGGFVSSQVFDHTSVIRFIEQRFGVHEPNISPFRRAVCGDLTSAFNFKDPDNSDLITTLPDTTALADRARALPSTTTPVLPDALALPVQASGVRPSRALPYELHVAELPADAADAGHITLELANTGKQAAVFHVYDRLHLDRIPHRYVVEADKHLQGTWDTTSDDGAYDLWVLGPNGFHRHFIGNTTLAAPRLHVRYDARCGEIALTLHNPSAGDLTLKLTDNAYALIDDETVTLAANSELSRTIALADSGHWYDLSVELTDQPRYLRRVAGRVETGRDSISDPALGGPAVGNQYQR
ncbi:MAG: phospholipase C, phosphocholine-specific [Polyangiales bacterium]